MSRRYPKRPMVGVGAIIFRGSEVLLVRRGREPALGLWSVPGGLVELGESLEQAVEREVYEEVGLRVDVKDLLAVLDRVIPDGNGRIEYHYILMDFFCTWQEGEPRPSSDATDCAFVPLEKLSEYPLTAGTEHVIRKVLARSRESCGSVYDPTL